MLSPNLSNQAPSRCADRGITRDLPASNHDPWKPRRIRRPRVGQGYLAIGQAPWWTLRWWSAWKNFTDNDWSDVDAALATTSDSDFEAVQGMTPRRKPAHYAAYLHEYQFNRWLAGFALTAHGKWCEQQICDCSKKPSSSKCIQNRKWSASAHLFDIAPNATARRARSHRATTPLNFAHPLVKISGSRLHRYTGIA